MWRFRRALAVAMSVVAVAACDGGAEPATAPVDTTATPPTTIRHRSTTTSEPATTATEPPGERAVVASITDGDTFRTTDGERVRLIGIDTPELADDACFADEATAALDALIPPGTEVRLVTDVERFDRYGRLLAYVERAADGLFVNRELARAGYAVQLTVPPNVARAEELGAAVAEARDAGRGLWGGCPTTTTAAAGPTGPSPTQAVVPVPGPGPGTGCDPSYPTVCIPPAPPDLDCPQIPHRRFTVVGADPHGFDGDHDGIGCESG